MHNADPATGRPAWLADRAVRVDRRRRPASVKPVLHSSARSSRRAAAGGCGGDARTGRTRAAAAMGLPSARRPGDAAPSHGRRRPCRARSAAAATGTSPKVIYLRYADGTETPHQPTTTPARGKVPQVRVHASRRHWSSASGRSRPTSTVVRRLQRHLHADAADERQVLHRGGLVGRRRLVQGRRQGRGRRAVPVQGPAAAASPTRSRAAAARTRRR